MKFKILLILLTLAFNVCASTYRVRLGDEIVQIQYLKGKGKTFVHLHQNETTALQAAKAVIKKQGGSLITLVHSGGRNIVFHLHHQRYEFDPNRIFTEQGIKTTLKQYSHYSPAAYRQVNKLARAIKHILPNGKIIAVHNNSNYSLKDYMPGHGLAKNAQALHMNPKNSYRNFYLVTKSYEYKRLKVSGYNGILQKPSAKDDGSLSVLLSKSNYINVEAGYDQLIEQIKMLKQA